MLFLRAQSSDYHVCTIENRACCHSHCISHVHPIPVGPFPGVPFYPLGGGGGGLGGGAGAKKSFTIPSIVIQQLLASATKVQKLSLEDVGTVPVLASPTSPLKVKVSVLVGEAVNLQVSNSCSSLL